MKLMLSAALLLTMSSNLFSQEKNGKRGKNFEQRKAQAIEHVEKRIESLQELKSCFSSATDKDSMKKCRKDHSEKRKGWKRNKKRN